MRRINPQKNRHCKEILHKYANGTDEPQALYSIKNKGHQVICLVNTALCGRDMDRQQNIAAAP